MPKYHEREIANWEHDQTLAVKKVMPYEWTGTQATASQSKLVAKKITVSGNDTYVATAPIGTAQATAGWQAKKIAVSGGDTVITWADGNASFDNQAVDLTSLNYS